MTAGARMPLLADLAVVEAAQLLCSGTLSAEAYAVSVLAIDLDTSAESRYLAQLASALDLSETDLAEIHAELGVAV